MTTQAIKTGTSQLPADLDNGVLTLILYCPEARNAMSGDLKDCLDLQLSHPIGGDQTADNREAVKTFVEKKAVTLTVVKRLFKSRQMSK